MSTADKVMYPKMVGSAVDLMFVEQSPIAYLIDCLTLYDTVVIPASSFALTSIYSHCDPGELDSLFSSQRIKYCPANSRISTKWNPSKSPAENILQDLPYTRDDERYSDLRRHLSEHTIDTADRDYSSWTATCDEARTAFIEASKRRGYEWLFPEDRSGQNHDRVVGLETGIARINDLLVAGIGSLDLDVELATYLEICFPTKRLDDILKDDQPAELTQRSLAEKLHRIENLPPLGDLVRTGKLSQSEAIRMVNSDEAAELRDWLERNIAPGIDVRDAYDRRLKELPSKKSWTGWLRFGAVSGVTTAVTSIVMLNPTISAGLGLLIGVADLQFGGHVLEKTVDPYHPRKWMSYVRKSAL